MSLTSKTFCSAFNFVSSSLCQYNFFKYSNHNYTTVQILNIAFFFHLLLLLFLLLYVLFIDSTAILTFYPQFRITDALLSFPFSEPLLVQVTAALLAVVALSVISQHDLILGFFSKVLGLDVPSNSNYTVPAIADNSTTVSFIWHFSGPLTPIVWFSYSSSFTCLVNIYFLAFFSIVMAISVPPLMP